MRRTVDMILTFALSALGGGIALFLGVPAGLLAGGGLAVAIATLSGFNTKIPGRLLNTIFVLIGLSMGANVAPDSLTLMMQWPITLAALVLELILIVLLVGFVLHKFFGLDRATAYLSSFPGHLSMTVALAEISQGDTRKLVVIQVTRVMILTLAVPFGVMFSMGSEGLATSQAGEQMGVSTMALIGLGCAVTGWVFSRLRMPAAYVLGSMSFATVTKLLGLYDGALHPWVLNLTFIATGALVGSRFGGITLAELRNAAVAGLVATGATILIVTGFAYGASLMVEMSFGQIWIGLAPGGLESMGALGVALGFDTAFIAAHHLSRATLLALAIPAFAYFVRSPSRRAARTPDAGAEEGKLPPG